jgi:hypothetical protein
MLRHSLHMDRSRGDVGAASMMREAVVGVVPGNIFRCSPRETVASLPGRDCNGKAGRFPEKLLSDRSETWVTDSESRLEF